MSFRVLTRVSNGTGQGNFSGQRDRSFFIVPGQRDNGTSSKSCHGTGRAGIFWDCPVPSRDVPRDKMAVFFFTFLLSSGQKGFQKGIQNDLPTDQKWCKKGSKRGFKMGSKMTYRLTNKDAKRVPKWDPKWPTYWLIHSISPKVKPKLSWEHFRSILQLFSRVSCKLPGETIWNYMIHHYMIHHHGIVYYYVTAFWPVLPFQFSHWYFSPTYK